MDIDIILDPGTTPGQAAELAVEAERYGIRAMWSSNYHQERDAFLMLAPAAAATSKLLMGPLAVSPWEMHPLKMANALLTLNELARGRAMLAVSGGGGVLAAIGWRLHPEAASWPRRDPVKKTHSLERRVRGVRECIEVLMHARSGKTVMGYTGGVFDINRPFRMKWADDSGPLVYSCSSAPQMIRMGARLADGLQLSDYTVDMMPHAMDDVRAGLAQRVDQPANFRVGNFWAWHLKENREASLWEARCELIWRGALIGREKHVLMKFCNDEDELSIIMEHWENFRKAFWTKTGVIENVPPDLVNRLIAGLSSSGDMQDLDREIERFRGFARSGLTELSLRLHNDPMAALKIIGEHVLPAIR